MLPDLRRARAGAWTRGRCVAASTDVSSCLHRWRFRRRIRRPGWPTASAQFGGRDPSQRQRQRCSDADARLASWKPLSALPDLTPVTPRRLMEIHEAAPVRAAISHARERQSSATARRTNASGPALNQSADARPATDRIKVVRNQNAGARVGRCRHAPAAIRSGCDQRAEIREQDDGRVQTTRRGWRSSVRASVMPWSQRSALRARLR